MVNNYEIIKTFLNDPKKYSPLIIVGDDKVVKSSILSKISSQKGWTICHSSEIVDELIESIKSGIRSEWKSAYLKKEALIIDDLDFIIHKETTTEELYNILKVYDKPIIITTKTIHGFSKELSDFLRRSTILPLFSNECSILSYLEEMIEQHLPGIDPAVKNKLLSGRYTDCNEVTGLIRSLKFYMDMGNSIDPESCDLIMRTLSPQKLGDE